MSTNYYLDFEPYNRESEKLHICKSLRMFRGYVEPHRFNGRYIPRLVSWNDWKTYLTATIVGDLESDAVIRSEYGMTADLADFIYLVETVPVEQRRRQFEFVRDTVNTSPVFIPPTTVGQIVSGGDWLDSEGYSFYGGEFS